MAESSGAEGYDPSKDPKRKAKSKDPGWKYGFWSELSDKNTVQCTLCGKKVNGGIKRFKQHLTGGYGDVSKCPRTTTEIAKEMHQAIMSNKRNKPIQFDDSDEVEEIQSSNNPRTASNPSDPSHASSTTVPSSGTAAKRMKSAFQFQFTKPQSQTKTIETHFRKSPEEVVDERHRKGPSQTTLENRGDDLTWEDVDRAVGSSDVVEGRNLPRRTQFYSRRGNASTSRAVNESDSNIGEEEEVLPNDDENVEDDYGRRVTTVSDDDDTAAGRDDDLILDDLA